MALLLNTTNTSNLENFPASETVIDQISYSVEIQQVHPAANKLTYKNYDHCFLGISLNNKSFASNKLDAMLTWISRRYPKCTILIADSVHRITLASTKGLDPDSALSEALSMGRDFVQQNQPLWDRYSRLIELNIVTCEEIQTWANYSMYHQELQKLFHEDLNFKHSVEKFGRVYHEKKSPNLDEKELNKLIQNSVDYFIEEFAITACLKDRGPSALVYPGSIVTLAEIADGLHPNAPDTLKKLTVVSLKLRRRPNNFYIEHTSPTFSEEIRE